MKDKELCYEKNYAILKNLLNISNIYVNVTLTGLTGLNKLQYLQLISSSYIQLVS